MSESTNSQSTTASDSNSTPSVPKFVGQPRVLDWYSLFQFSDNESKNYAPRNNNINLTTAPSRSRKSATSVPKFIRQLQRGSIHQTFQKLFKKWDRDRYPPRRRFKSNIYADTDHETWDHAFNRLRFYVLPTLREQINALPNLLDPSGLQDDRDGSKHKLIMEIQSGLDHNLDHIFSIDAGINQRSKLLRPETDDYDLEGLKEFTRKGLVNRLGHLCRQIGKIIELGCRTMVEMKNPAKSTLEFKHRGEFIRVTTTATNSIDQLTKWIASHEFINIQEHWDQELNEMDGLLVELTECIDYSTNIVHLPWIFRGETPGKALIPAAQSLIPVIKLSRLFFKKVARDGLNKVPLKPFSDMSSHQLVTLQQTAGYVTHDLSHITSEIIEQSQRDHGSNASDASDGNDLSGPTTELIKQLRNHFDSNLLLVIMYIIPLVPPSISSPGPNDLHNFLLVWNKLFSIATRNCVQAAHDFDAIYNY